MSFWESFNKQASLKSVAKKAKKHIYEHRGKYIAGAGAAATAAGSHVAGRRGRTKGQAEGYTVGGMMAKRKGATLPNARIRGPYSKPYHVNFEGNKEVDWSKKK